MNEQIAAEIESAIPAMMERVKADAIKAIEQRAVQQATDIAVKAAAEWASENLVPEIRAALEAGRPGLVKAAHDTAELIGEAIKLALVKKAEDTLKTSWGASSAVKAIFGN